MLFNNSPPAKNINVLGERAHCRGLNAVNSAYFQGLANVYNSTTTWTIISNVVVVYHIELLMLFKTTGIYVYYKQKRPN